MNTIPIEYPNDWSSYELIDSGDGEKLESYAGYTMIRPDPRVLWSKSHEQNWQEAEAHYVRDTETKGHWNTKKPAPSPWRLTYQNLTFTLRPTEFKHVGVFPEQAVNWQWIKNQTRPQTRVLNLFGYTGGATLAALAAGAAVTHVDAVYSAISWARENANASNLSQAPTRWIEEDAMKFVLREQRRLSQYEGIIMDPPRFGRGSKGEVWKIEKDLPKLLAVCKTLLIPKESYLILNAYTADISPIALYNLVEDIFPSAKVTIAELCIKEKNTQRLLPNGLVVRCIL